MTSPFEQIVPLSFQRRGGQQVAVTQAPAHDVTLIAALGRAIHWQSLIESGHYRSVTELATAEGKTEATVRAVIKLSLLAPDLIEEILAGHQPRRLTLLYFQRKALPMQWTEQRELFARFREDGAGE